ncbi:hypothetical protein jhhlp_002075 [Lomentospora prolificans]|uniref:Anaphase-promoting complex subunit 4 n=1 Tax=Lomentospora prolificans TaxID=41688 RepID=A0A2N3ND01_9PEZI|nr:hypothetical protein jhhlp_002075 [Lomentospora prolificans]
MLTPITLSAFSETKYERPAQDGLPVSSPTVDLSVTWDGAGGNVLVYRPKNEVVSKIHQAAKGRREAAAVTAVRWKPDGQFIAVAWDDGYVRLMGLENNKAAHNIKVLEAGQAKITHIGWTSNSVMKKFERRIGNATSTWQGVLGKDAPTADLPRELTFLEVDTALPKISPLPSGSAGSGEDSMVFTLRTGIDFLFQPFKPEDSEEVSVMIVGTDKNDIHLSIYDSFTVGTFKYRSTEEPNMDFRLLHHASHHDLSTHALVFKSTHNSLAIVPMDLSFIVSSPINLSLLASKLTTLQKLLRYLRQTLLHMQVEFKNARELPSRFLANVQEDLQSAENGPRDIVPALYHTLVTGHTYEIVKEWLVDSLAERGHKRWDRAVVSGLENLRSIIHENFLPALERCGVILSRLKGLAQFYETRDDTGLTAIQITRLMDTVACLTLVGHHMLLIVMEELELFTSFSSWLRFQIDRLATSSGTDELMEREATMNNSHILAYIRKYLLRSPLAVFLVDDETSGDWEAVTKGQSLLEALDAQLKKHENGQQFAKFLPNLHWLLSHLDDRASGVFNDIAQSQKRSVRFGHATRVALEHEIRGVDIRMDTVPRLGDVVDGLAYTAITIKEKENEILLFRTSIPIVNGISSKVETQCCAVSVAAGKVIDIKFLTPTILLILTSQKDSSPSLLSLSLSTPTLPWVPYAPSTPFPAPFQLEPDTVVSTEIPIRKEDEFVPVQMDIHDKSESRGPMPIRVCLLSKDRCRYRVFELKQG